jgi:hypothetical protein
VGNSGWSSNLVLPGIANRGCTLVASRSFMGGGFLGLSADGGSGRGAGSSTGAFAGRGRGVSVPVSSSSGGKGGLAGFVVAGGGTDETFSSNKSSKETVPSSSLSAGTAGVCASSKGCSFSAESGASFSSFTIIFLYFLALGKSA